MVSEAVGLIEAVDLGAGENTGRALSVEWEPGPCVVVRLGDAAYRCVITRVETVRLPGACEHHSVSSFVGNCTIDDVRHAFLLIVNCAVEPPDITFVVRREEVLIEQERAVITHDIQLRVLNVIGALK